MEIIRTIEKIKQLRAKGCRKWGKDLYLHILPLVNGFQTVEEIRDMLNNEYELEITSDQIRDIIKYYRRKLTTPIPVPAPVSPASFQTPDSLVQKQEVSQPLSAPSPPSRPKRNYEVEKDYRTPVPKPTSIFGTKKAPDQ